MFGINVRQLLSSWFWMSPNLLEPELGVWRAGSGVCAWFVLVGRAQVQKTAPGPWRSPMVCTRHAFGELTFCRSVHACL